MTARFRTTTSAGGAVTVTAVDYLDSAGIRVLYEFAASHSLEVLVQPGGVAVVTLEVSGLVNVVTIRHPSTDVAERGGTPL